MNEEKKKYDLQERFIDYAVRIINLSEQLPETKTGKHIAYQMLRSGTSPAANYGEVQSAESRADSIHKLKISLKELRESEVWLKIIIKAKIIQPSTTLNALAQETDELISILFKSIDTARKNNGR
ncbi:MAG: four helix bundle protein [Candidatus Cloacimonetes bacterium]|nr:four helix bundle protein [Candidatus Cloacimonadota bacterium]